MAAPRIRRVLNRREMETVRDDFITQGYEVLREGEGTLLMRRSTWGSTGNHVLIGLLTIWWTPAHNLVDHWHRQCAVCGRRP